MKALTSPHPLPLPRNGRGEAEIVTGVSVAAFVGSGDRRLDELPSPVAGEGQGVGVFLIWLKAILLVAIMLALPHAAHARPRYAKAEGVSCAYCHNDPNTGGKRNYRGDFYQKQMHSFANFNDAAEAKAANVEVGPEADKKPASLVAGKSVLPPPTGKSSPVSAPTPTPAPKLPFTDPRNTPDFGEWVSPERIAFIKIPAGNYVRGTTDAQRDALQKAGQWSPMLRVEQPAKTVTISRPFLISKTEVTQKQWNDLMVPPPPPKVYNKGKEVKPKIKPAVNPSAFQNDKEAPERPVENVSWYEVKGYCKAMIDAAKADGDARGLYRLPTEAEWEYAARAGSNDLYPAGPNKKPVDNQSLAAMAWMNANAANKTHPVGQKEPNAWGLYDMAGNVWEWCEDAYSPSAYQNLPDRDPIYQNKYATERVMRGGCWFLDARAQRVGLRSANLPTLKSQYVGFRIVRDL